MSVDYVKLYNLTTLNRKNKINKQKQTIYVCVCVRACMRVLYPKNIKTVYPDTQICFLRKMPSSNFHWSKI